MRQRLQLKLWKPTFAPQEPNLPEPCCLNRAETTGSPSRSYISASGTATAACAASVTTTAACAASVTTESPTACFIDASVENLSISRLASLNLIQAAP